MNPLGCFRLASRVLLFGLACAACDAADVDANRAWEDLATLRFAEAAQAFDRMAGTGGAEARFGRAVSLLARQPRTAANVDEAERLFAELFTPEAAALDADLAARARLAHARIPHLHRQPIQWAEAEARYRAAYAAAPGHEAGQAALVRAGLVSLFRVQGEAEVRRLAEAFAAEADALTAVDVRRDADLLHQPGGLPGGGGGARRHPGPAGGGGEALRGVSAPRAR
ncbi:MAG: hypothetical protein MUE42_15935 [Opitutaceae bacterium]|nr:hypothetical protein [Opitutaceae bacterium]